MVKEWMCVQVKHHKDVASAIERFQKNGWRFHTYQVTGRDGWISHYFCLKRASETKQATSQSFIFVCLPCAMPSEGLFLPDVVWTLAPAICGAFKEATPALNC